MSELMADAFSCAERLKRLFFLYAQSSLLTLFGGLGLARTIHSWYKALCDTPMSYCFLRTFPHTKGQVAYTCLRLLSC